MEDKILQIKCEMKRIIKARKLTRMERYDLLEKQIKLLEEKEKRILINECNRDYKSADRSEDIKEIITIGLSGISIIITLLGIFFGEMVIEFDSFYKVVCLVGIILIVFVLALSWVQNQRSKNMDIANQILDVLTEEEDYKQ